MIRKDIFSLTIIIKRFFVLHFPQKLCNCSSLVDLGFSFSFLNFTVSLIIFRTSDEDYNSTSFVWSDYYNVLYSFLFFQNSVFPKCIFGRFIGRSINFCKLWNCCFCFNSPDLLSSFRSRYWKRWICSKIARISVFNKCNSETRQRTWSWKPGQRYIQPKNSRKINKTAKFKKLKKNPTFTGEGQLQSFLKKIKNKKSFDENTH